eukprot:TRINITY_DN465_c2_g1_i1.p1 TRINITY_DN465_c2_g1~~TRINITY_DN465_c2_g1_i1.p1  ORF type:complete len:360 (+),score=54.81 TRINITY_DN465_c2_g1_i1:151-1230(+)
MSKFVVLVGSYTQWEGHLLKDKRHGHGIYRYELNVDDFSIKTLDPAFFEAGVNPTYLCHHPNKKFLYVVCEKYGDKSEVVSFSIDESGNTKKINLRYAEEGACHVVADSAGKFLFVSNYGDGKVSVYPINDDGSLGESTETIEHHGTGPNTARQERAHCHQVVFDKKEKFAFISDLGKDQVVVYSYSNGKLLPTDKSLSVKGGRGPRHFIFHPSMKFAYVVNELSSTVEVCDYNEETGVLTSKAEVSTLPSGTEGLDNSCSAIRVTNNGDFLFVSNRGHNSIAVFKVGTDGNITLVNNHPSGGLIPRDFNIDPTEKSMVIVNQNSDSLKLCKLDASSGTLTDVTTLTTGLHTPVAVLFH